MIANAGLARHGVAEIERAARLASCAALGGRNSAGRNLAAVSRRDAARRIHRPPSHSAGASGTPQIRDRTLRTGRRYDQPAPASPIGSTRAGTGPRWPGKARAAQSSASTACAPALRDRKRPEHRARKLAGPVLMRSLEAAYRLVAAQIDLLDIREAQLPLARASRISRRQISRDA
jgi:hypothetical protein